MVNDGGGPRPNKFYKSSWANNDHSDMEELYLNPLHPLNPHAPYGLTVMGLVLLFFALLASMETPLHGISFLWAATGFMCFVTACVYQIIIFNHQRAP
jgi:hypothetical protein